MRLPWLRSKEVEEEALVSVTTSGVLVSVLVTITLTIVPAMSVFPMVASSATVTEYAY